MNIWKIFLYNENSYKNRLQILLESAKMAKNSAILIIFVSTPLNLGVQISFLALYAYVLHDIAWMMLSLYMLKVLGIHCK